MRRSKRIEFGHSFFEERLKPIEIPSRVMVEGRRNLNQTVQEPFFVTSCMEPHGFEGFVSFEILFCVE